MSIERIVDEMDAWLDEHLHGRFPAPAAEPSRGRGERGPSRERLTHAREDLRRTTAGLLFLRNKLEAEQTERRVRMARACHAILRAVRDDDDETALPLLTYRDTLREHIQHAEQELAGVRTQAADAKDALARLHHAMERTHRPARAERARRHRRTHR